MTDHPTLRFAAIDLDHRHIYDQVQSLLDIGAQCVGYWTRDEAKPLPGFVERFPHIPRVLDRRRLLEDPSIQLVTCAAIPMERASLAIEHSGLAGKEEADLVRMSWSERLDRLGEMLATE